MATFLGSFSGKHHQIQRPTVFARRKFGLGCVWYTGQFYALYFLQSVLKVDFLTANVCVAVALAIGTPLIVVSGALSDRIGRRPLIVTGLSLAAAL